MRKIKTVFIAAMIIMYTFCIAGCFFGSKSPYGKDPLEYVSFGSGRYIIEKFCLSDDNNDNINRIAYSLCDMLNYKKFGSPNELLWYLFEYRITGSYIYAIGNNCFVNNEYGDYLDGKIKNIEISYAKVDYEKGERTNKRAGNYKVWDDINAVPEEDKAIFEELRQEWETRLKNGEGEKLHK